MSSSIIIADSYTIVCQVQLMLLLKWTDSYTIKLSSTFFLHIQVSVWITASVDHILAYPKCTNTLNFFHFSCIRHFRTNYPSHTANQDSFVSFLKGNDTRVMPDPSQRALITPALSVWTNMSFCTFEAVGQTESEALVPGWWAPKLDLNMFVN